MASYAHLFEMVEYYFGAAKPGYRASVSHYINGVYLGFYIMREGNYTYSGSSLPISISTDGPMVVLICDTLTVSSGAVLTPPVRTKGMLVAAETLYNYGTISMTDRGAWATGQNIWLWDGQYVPAVGGAGGSEYTAWSSRASRVQGGNGQNGSGRQTGGGGSGAGSSWSGLNITAPKGGDGTSYSGGAGGGFIMRHGSSYPNPWIGDLRGNDQGGPGGRGYVYWDTGVDTTTGGVGNPGGQGYTQKINYWANQVSGTGGLLIIYTDYFYNAGSLTAYGRGAALPGRGKWKHCGGESGGGSVNVFYKSIGRWGGYSAAALRGSGVRAGHGTVTFQQIDMFWPKLFWVFRDSDKIKRFANSRWDVL